MRISPFIDLRFGRAGMYRIGIGRHFYQRGISAYLGTFKIIIPGLIITKGYF